MDTRILIQLSKLQMNITFSTEETNVCLCMHVHCTVIPRLTVVPGESKNARLIGGTVNRGKVNTCSIVELDIGGTQRGTLYRGTR